MPIDTKQSSPQITDSALRMNSEFPELPDSVTQRFPEMATWAQAVDKFWRQNVNAVDDFARAVLDVTEIAGVLVVDSSDASLSIRRGTRKGGAWNDPDTPFYVNRDGFFSLANNLTWNPQERELTVTGTIIADSGTIGGWDITPTTLHKNNAVLDSAGQLALGTGNDIIILSSTDPTYRIWAGNATAGSASFSVTKAGVLFATGATISGTITATAGTIGGFNIGADYIRDVGNSMGLASTVTGGDDVRFWAGAAFANRNTAPFRMTESGALFSSSATFSGAVTITTTDQLLVSSNSSFFTWQGASIGSPGIFFQHDAVSTKGLSLLGVGSTTATSTVLGFNKARGSFGAFSNVSTDDVVGSVRFYSYTGVGPWQALSAVRAGITNSINTPYCLVDVGPSSGATSYWVFNYDGKLYFSDAVPANSYGSPYVSDSLSNLYRSTSGTMKTDGNFIVGTDFDLQGSVTGLLTFPNQTSTSHGVQFYDTTLFRQNTRTVALQSSSDTLLWVKSLDTTNNPLIELKTIAGSNAGIISTNWSSGGGFLYLAAGSNTPGGAGVSLSEAKVAHFLGTTEAGTGGTGTVVVDGGIYSTKKLITGSTLTTASGIAWDFGNQNLVSPTAPNRTITVSVGGTTLYLHAKTTND